MDPSMIVYSRLGTSRYHTNIHCRFLLNTPMHNWVSMQEEEAEMTLDKCIRCENVSSDGTSRSK